MEVISCTCGYCGRQRVFRQSSILWGPVVTFEGNHGQNECHSTQRRKLDAKAHTKQIWLDRYMRFCRSSLWLLEETVPSNVNVAARGRGPLDETHCWPRVYAASLRSLAFIMPQEGTVTCRPLCIIVIVIIIDIGDVVIVVIIAFLVIVAVLVLIVIVAVLVLIVMRHRHASSLRVFVKLHTMLAVNLDTVTIPHSDGSRRDAPVRGSP